MANRLSAIGAQWTPRMGASHVRQRLGLLGCCLAWVGTVGCYDQECGNNQVLDDELELCVCVAGTSLQSDRTCSAEVTDEGDSGAGDDDAGMESGAADDPCMADGQGCPCTSDDDCAGYEADYCIIADPANPDMPRACLLQGCQDGCPDDLQCCDFPFAPGETVCLPADVECPFG